jgi:hypothetical protein
MRTTTGASGLFRYPSPPSDVGKELHFDVPLDNAATTDVAFQSSARGANVASARERERMRRATYMYIQGLRFDGIL